MDSVFWMLMIVLIAAGVDGIKVLVSIPEGKLTEAIKNATKQETKILETELKSMKNQLQSIQALLKKTSGSATEQKPEFDPTSEPTSEPDSMPDSTPEPEPEPERVDKRTKGENSLRLVSHRLEVFHNGEWGTVCDDGFTYNNARVACRTMGKTGGSKYASSSSLSSWNYDSAGTGKIWLRFVKCTGSESSFFHCTLQWGVGAMGHAGCTHGEDVYMTCRA